MLMLYRHEPDTATNARAVPIYATTVSPNTFFLCSYMPLCVELVRMIGNYHFENLTYDTII